MCVHLKDPDRIYVLLMKILANAKFRCSRRTNLPSGTTPRGTEQSIIIGLPFFPNAIHVLLSTPELTIISISNLLFYQRDYVLFYKIFKASKCTNQHGIKIMVKLYWNLKYEYEITIKNGGSTALLRLIEHLWYILYTIMINNWYIYFWHVIKPAHEARGPEGPARWER